MRAELAVMAVVVAAVRHGERKCRAHALVRQMAAHVEQQAHHGKPEQRPRAERVEHQRERHDRAQEKRLHRMKAISGKRRGHDRAVMPDMDAAIERLPVQQPVHRVEVDLVPDVERRQFPQEAPRGPVPVNHEPARAQQPHQAHGLRGKDQDGARGEQQLLAHLARAHALRASAGGIDRIGQPAHGEGIRAARNQRVDRAEP
jgi:hypothetical protein